MLCGGAATDPIVAEWAILVAGPMTGGGELGVLMAGVAEEGVIGRAGGKTIASWRKRENFPRNSERVSSPYWLESRLRRKSARSTWKTTASLCSFFLSLMSSISMGERVTRS